MDKKRYIDKLKILANSGINKKIHITDDSIEELPTIEERVNAVLGLLKKPKKIEERMLFFVMYDIEDNRVRRYISKYLEKSGCIRVQKSIFLANTSSEVFNTIKSDLTEVQSAYNNLDSILVVPISTEYLRSMKIIGNNIDIDIILRDKNTLFF